MSKTWRNVQASRRALIFLIIPDPRSRVQPSNWYCASSGSGISSFSTVRHNQARTRYAGHNLDCATDPDSSRWETSTHSDGSGISCCPTLEPVRWHLTGCVMTSAIQVIAVDFPQLQHLIPDPKITSGSNQQLFGSGIRPARSSGQRPMLFQPDPRSHYVPSLALVHFTQDFFAWDQGLVLVIQVRIKCILNTTRSCPKKSVRFTPDILDGFAIFPI